MKKLILLLLLSCSPLWAVNHTRIVRSCPNGTTCAYASGLNGYVLVGNGVDFDYQLFSGVPAGLQIGVSTITSGADQRVLFQDGTVVAENANFTFVKGTATLHATHMTATDFTGALIGNSSTSTAFDHNPANCSAGNYPLGIDATGAVESCTAVASGLTVGSTSISSGVSTRVLFDDVGVLGESAGLTYVKGTGTLSATAFSGPLTGNVTGNVTGALTGNASTATALAANGTNCSSGSFPLGVDASGNSESCTTVSSVVPDLSALAFVTVGNTSSLSAERAITAGNNIALTDGGANSTETIAEGTGAVSFTNAITPTQIAANTDDYNPTGLSTAYTLRLSTDASRNLTGISASGAGAVEGRQLVIQNVGSNPLVLKNLTTSSAANQFSNGGKDITLSAGGSITMQYDNTAQLWRVRSPKVRLTGTGSEPSECADDQIQSVSDGTNNQCTSLTSGASITTTTGSGEFTALTYTKTTNAITDREFLANGVFGRYRCTGFANLENITNTGWTTENCWSGSTITDVGTSPVKTVNDLAGSTHLHTANYKTKVSSPTSGDTSGVQNQGLPIMTQFNPRMMADIVTDSTLTSSRLYIGAFQNATVPAFTVASTFTATTIGALIMVVYDTGGSLSSNFALCTATDNGANHGACIDTGVAVVASTQYKISIYTLDAGTTIVANINGTEVSVTSSIPASNTSLGRVTAVIQTTLTSAQRSINIASIGLSMYTD